MSNINPATITVEGYPPFSGDDVECVKCGNKGAATVYLEYGRCSHGDEVAIGWEKNERLHRRCERCGFQWDEATVEAKTA